MFIIRTVFQKSFKWLFPCKGQHLCNRKVDQDGGERGGQAFSGNAGLSENDPHVNTRSSGQATMKSTTRGNLPKTSSLSSHGIMKVGN